MKCQNCSTEMPEGCFEFKGKWFCSQECMVEYGEKPANMIGWEIVEEQIKKNSKPRINWKVLLGMSLTRALARCKAAGLSQDLTYKTLVFEHPEWSDEIKRRLQIGIAARFGEMATSQSEIRRNRNETENKRN